MGPVMVLKKKSVEADDSARKKILDILKSSAIITDTFTGTLTINFNQGNIAWSEKQEKNPL